MTVRLGCLGFTLYRIERDHSIDQGVFVMRNECDQGRGIGLQVDAGGTGRFGYIGEKHMIYGFSVWLKERRKR